MGNQTKVRFITMALAMAAMSACGDSNDASGDRDAADAGDGSGDGADTDVSTDGDAPSDSSTDGDGATDTARDGDAADDGATDSDAANDADAVTDVTDDTTEGDAANDADAVADVTDDTTEGDAATDADVTPPVRCLELDCAGDGRTCVESVSDADAVCGDCLPGFLTQGDACIPPECGVDDDCTPDNTEGEWSACGGYADVCAIEGVRTRQLFDGRCVAGRCQVDTAEEEGACPELRATDGVACAVGAIAGICDGGACLTPLPPPESVRASDGTSSTVVVVTWAAVDGAAGYLVYRDDVLLTPEPVTELEWADFNAPAGDVPSIVSGLEATGASDQILVAWNAVPNEGPVGATVTYTVATVNGAGEGEASPGDPGYRAGFAPLNYEVRIDGADWMSAGTATSFLDADAPLGALTLNDVAATDGTSEDSVGLSATVALGEGASRSYEVRAVNAAGVSDASPIAFGAIQPSVPPLRWQRSSGSSPDGFSDLPGLDTAEASDTDAPADGARRYYRVVVDVPGQDPVTSAADDGYRIAALDAPCDATNAGACGPDAWCSDVVDYEVCSPRLFAGEDYALDFTFVPAGTFLQGTPGATNMERPYTATLTRNYFVSRTEVTQAQWQAAGDGTNPACFQDPATAACTTINAAPNAPIEQIDWYAALAFANRLSELEGLDACYVLSGCTDSAAGWYDGAHAGCTGATFTGLECSGYRLLTESEWERAARGGTTGSYFWGEATDVPTVGLYAWFSRNAGGQTRAVAQLQPNAYGLFDTSGHVWEWVWDVALTPGFVYIPYPTDSATDYTGPSEAGRRGMRGGAYSADAPFARPARRNGFGETVRDRAVGFRLGRTAP